VSWIGVKPIRDSAACVHRVPLVYHHHHLHCGAIYGASWPITALDKPQQVKVPEHLNNCTGTICYIRSHKLDQQIPNYMNVCYLDGTVCMLVFFRERYSRGEWVSISPVSIGTSSALTAHPRSLPISSDASRHYRRNSFRYHLVFNTPVHSAFSPVVGSPAPPTRL
jgi:hypothetical protein